MAPRSARCRARQRCHDRVCIPQAPPRLGPTRDPPEPWRGSEAGSSPAGALSGFGAVSRWQRNGRGKRARPLKAYSARELNRWHLRLIRKGRNLGTLDALRRHRLRIRAKRFRYMLEALTDLVPLRGRDGFRHVHQPAKRLQRVLGDLRDLERLARLGVSARGGSRPRKPPDYRWHRKKLLRAAVEAYRSLKQAGRC